MRLLHNPEVRRLLLAVGGIGLAAAVGCALLSPWAGLVVAVAFAGVAALFVWHTRRRYDEIERLNAYLMRINRGDDSLDVRDNREGELSILKSEIYKVTVTLREKNERLRQDKRAMADALSDISHQLKTPLTSMTVMTDLLCDGNLPEAERRVFTGRMGQQLERLQWLVSALLKFSRLDAGTADMPVSTVVAGELIARATEPLRILLEVKNQTLQIEGGDIIVPCNERWTAEALLNVLKNCAEYTPEGGSISVRCERNPLFAQIVVTDSGPGIDPDDLPHLFERFYRGRNAGDDSVGIGLALAAAIVRGQGGTVEAETLPGGGSAFTLRFPRRG